MGETKVKHFLIILIVTVAVFLTFRYLLPLFLPFIIAFVLAWILTPFVKLMSRKLRFPVMFSSVVGILILMAIISTVLFFLGKVAWEQLVRLGEHFPEYEQAFFNGVEDICEKADGLLGKDVGTARNTIFEENGFVDRISTWIISNATQVTIDFAGLLVAFLGVLLIVFVSAVLILYERVTSKKEEEREKTVLSRVLDQFSKAGAAYLKTQFILMLIIGGISSLGLALLKNPYALLIGLGIGVMDAFPVLGSGMILGPWTVITFFNGKFREGFILLIIYGACQIAREFLEPKLLGDKIGVKPIYTIMSMYIGIKLFGVTGFILGPLGLVVIKSVVFEFEESIDLQCSGKKGSE
ncbi:MAG: sporulation integral membrane protein YtvI [Lachnospiraceae bacterium]